MEKKSGLITVAIVLLALLVGLLGGYVLKDVLSDNNSEIGTSENNTNDKNSQGIDVINKKYKDKDIVFSSYNKQSDEYSYSIPYINIDSKEVDKINQEIDNYYINSVNQSLKDAEDGLAIDLTGIKYDFYINGNILSLVISSSAPSDFNYYRAYNVDIKRQTKISNSDLIRLKGISEDALAERLKIKYKEKFVSKYGSRENHTDKKLYDELLAQTISSDNCSIKTPIFLNSSGKISAIALISSFEGATEYYHIIDLNL